LSAVVEHEVGLMQRFLLNYAMGCTPSCWFGSRR